MNAPHFTDEPSASEATHDGGTTDPWLGVPITHFSSVDSFFERSYSRSCDRVSSGDSDDVQSPDADDPPGHLEQSSLRSLFFNSDTHLWLLNLGDLRQMSRIATADGRSSDSSSGLRPDCPFYCGSPVCRVVGIASLHAKAFQGDPEGWSVDLNDDTNVVRCYLSTAIADECFTQSEGNALSELMAAVLRTRCMAIPQDSSGDALPELGRRLFFVGEPIWTKAGFVLVLESLRAIDDLNEEALFRGVQAEVYRDVYLPLKRSWCRRLAFLQLRKLLEHADATSAGTMTRDNVKVALEALLQSEERLK
ncbi:unnamed protein product [Ixodes hexagonus]